MGTGSVARGWPRREPERRRGQVRAGSRARSRAGNDADRGRDRRADRVGYWAAQRRRADSRGHVPGGGTGSCPGWSARRYGWGGRPTAAIPPRRSCSTWPRASSTGYALLATTGVLEALFAAGPTPDRFRAALPSLILVAIAVAARAGLADRRGLVSEPAGAAGRLVVEVRLSDLTTRRQLAAFEEAKFHDQLLRARKRGHFRRSGWLPTSSTSPPRSPAYRGRWSWSGAPAGAARRLGAGPTAWRRGGGPVGQDRIPDQVRADDTYRRKGILDKLMAERQTAAEIRSFTLRAFLVERVGPAGRLHARRRDAGGPPADGDQGDRQRAGRGRDRRRVRGARRPAGVGLGRRFGAGTAVIAIRSAQASLQH